MEPQRGEGRDMESGCAVERRGYWLRILTAWGLSCWALYFASLCLSFLIYKQRVKAASCGYAEPKQEGVLDKALEDVPLPSTVPGVSGSE